MEHMIFWRKVSTKLNKQYREAKLNKHAKSEKENKYKTTHGGRSIRVQPGPEGTGLTSPGEHRETCDITCEGLTHATVAFSAPDISDDAIVLRDDPQ